jgi:hypothetical protein
MVFWIAILVGVLFVWLAVRMGFYETWVLLFNIIVSMYLAIFAAPIIAELAPTPGGAASYSMALSMALLGGGSFALLQGLSYVFLTGQYSVPFPRIFDIVFSGLLGFLAGFLVLSFAALVLATTPLADNEIVTGVGLGRQSQQINISCISRCCDVIHSLAGPADLATQAAVQRLLDESKPKPVVKREPADVNQPAAPAPPEKKAGPPANDNAAPRTKADSPPRQVLPRRTIPVE